MQHMFEKDKLCVCVSVGGEEWEEMEKIQQGVKGRAHSEQNFIQLF